MKIEKVRVKTTLKAGGQVWQKGDVITGDIPQPLLNEVRLGKSTVEILQQTEEGVDKKKSAPSLPKSKLLVKPKA